MDRLKLVDKLREKVNISYEEAKNALENSNWDILDAMLYLEAKGIIKGPEISVFYSNDDKSYRNQEEEFNINETKASHNFEGIFEAICKAIDTCNNIFIEVKRKGRLLLNLPLTVLIILLFFGFWVIIPLIIIALFFEIEFSVSSKKVNTANANNMLKKVSSIANNIKKQFDSGS